MGKFICAAFVLLFPMRFSKIIFNGYVAVFFLAGFAPAPYHVAAVLSLSPSCSSFEFAHCGIALYEYHYDDDDTNKSYIEKPVHGTMMVTIHKYIYVMLMAKRKK